jgi:L-lactate permease
MSRALASRIASVCATSAPAIACNAAFFVSVSSAASTCAASRAARQTSDTLRVTVATCTGYASRLRGRPGGV